MQKLVQGGEALASATINSLTSKFNRNQLILYTFDSRDVKSDGLAASNIRWLPQRLVASHNSSHITAGREFLRGVSEPTGGNLISDHVNIMEEVRGFNRSFYIVGVEGAAGEEPGDKGLDIEIVINDPSGLSNNLEVKSRGGFYTLLAGSSDEVLTGAFQFPFYFRDFSVNFKVGTNEEQITVQAEIPPEALQFIKDRNDYFLHA